MHLVLPLHWRQQKSTPKLNLYTQIYTIVPKYFSAHKQPFYLFAAGPRPPGILISTREPLWSECVKVWVWATVPRVRLFLILIGAEIEVLQRTIYIARAARNPLPYYIHILYTCAHARECDLNCGGELAQWGGGVVRKRSGLFNSLNKLHG